MSTKLVSNLELLRRVPLFALLSTAQAEIISQAVVKRRFKRGEILVKQDTKSESLFILLTGRVRVLITDKRGREVILTTLCAGDHLGEMGMIDNQVASATVEAEVQTDVLSLSRPEFLSCIQNNTSVAYAVMKMLVQRLRIADQKIESLALMDVYGRVARVLLENAQEDAQGHLTIAGKISRQDLAKMVGASREMVSRVMKDLEDRGYILVNENGNMVVRDLLQQML